MVPDEVIGIVGSVGKNDMVLADSITRPDIPGMRVPNKAKADVSAAFISDIHIGSKTFLPEQWEKFTKWLKSCEDGAEKVKYLVISGDMVDGVGVFPGQENELLIQDIHEQYQEFAGKLAEIPDHIRVIILPGNHETFATVEFLAKQYAPGVYNLHGRSILLYDEIGIFGCGSANIGLFEMGDKEVKSTLKKAFEPIKGAKRKILITHAPPYGTKLDALWAHVGSKGVRDIIEETKPDLCLCGHIHETFGMHQKVGRTEVINVGPKGVIVNIQKKTDNSENKLTLN